MPDAVVIGAGLSGLTAALRLAAAGAEVTVLEASSRVGGRAWTRVDHGIRWEAGAEAVDISNDRLQALAAELGSPIVRSDVGWGDHGPRPSLASVAGRTGFAPPPAYLALLDQLELLGAAPNPAADRISVSEWLAAWGAAPFDRAVAEAMISVAASTAPLRAMSVLALAVKHAARGGPRSDSELRLEDGAGRLAQRAAARLGGRVHLHSRATAVRQGRAGVDVRVVGAAPVRAARAVLAVPLHARSSIEGAPLPPPGAAYGVAVKSLIELDADLSDRAPSSVVTDGLLGYAYRRHERALGSFVGSAPARQLARLTDLQALEHVGAVVRRLFGTRPVRITRVVYPRSYLILAPGQLTGWGDRLSARQGRVHLAGAEASELPSFMEGAVRAGERAAAEVAAAG